MKNNLHGLRKEFPILKRIVYLDNAATSLTPNVVLDAMNDYYRNYKSNVHRGIHQLSEKATLEFEEARKKVSRFINCNKNEIVFTSGATESLNILARGIAFEKGDEILLTEMEHHSNIVPWQTIAKEKKLVIKYAKVKEGGLDLNEFKKLVNNKTRVVSVTHVSNVLGCKNDVKLIARIAHKYNAIMVVDGAQSVAHFKIDVKELDCDFFVFSGHKMFGPTGIGVLYGKKEYLSSICPLKYGGGMIKEVSFKDSKFLEIPGRLEAGTPNIAGAIGLGKAIEYIESVEIDNIEKQQDKLSKYALEKLSKINGLEIYSKEGNVISFNVNGVHAHDVAAYLDKERVAIRAGHMCAMPLVKDVLKVQGICRASFCFYNNFNDIDRLAEALLKIRKVFG